MLVFTVTERVLTSNTRNQSTMTRTTHSFPVTLRNTLAISLVVFSVLFACFVLTSTFTFTIAPSTPAHGDNTTPQHSHAHSLAHAHSFTGAAPVSESEHERNAHTGAFDEHSLAYGVETVNAPHAWSAFNTKGDNATIAVLDSGVNTDQHPELTVPDDGWRDFVNDRDTPYDDHADAHGTVVSGIATADPVNNAEAYYSVAPNATLLHGKVIDENNHASYETQINGLEWVIEHDRDVDVVVMSIESRDDEFAEELLPVVERATREGIVIVSITGNTADETASPGNMYDTISVGSIDEHGQIDPSSGSGEVVTRRDWGSDAPSDWPSEYTAPDVVAPGVLVPGPDGAGGVSYSTGTSFAAPHVAGTVALMQSATDRELSPVEIKTVVQDTSRTPDTPGRANTSVNHQYGHGVIDAFDAVNTVTSPTGNESFAVTV